MPHDIIDNRELHLADAVRPLLSEFVHSHFAVGYFFLSGFKAIADQLATVQDLRLLIGNTSDRATIEQLAEGRRRRFRVGGEDVMQTSRRDQVGGGIRRARKPRAMNETPQTLSIKPSSSR